MSRSRILDRMTRYQWFESGFLQRGVIDEPCRRGGMRWRRGRLAPAKAIDRPRRWRKRADVFYGIPQAWAPLA